MTRSCPERRRFQKGKRAARIVRVPVRGDGDFAADRELSDAWSESTSPARVGNPVSIPLREAARLGNAAARLMEAFVAGVQALTRLKAGGRQRVVVQHQQVVVSQDGSGVVLAAASRSRRTRGRPARGRREK